MALAASQQQQLRLDRLELALYSTRVALLTIVKSHLQLRNVRLSGIVALTSTERRKS
jgi:hypothetical protein